jgi:hypothetical protein
MTFSRGTETHIEFLKCILNKNWLALLVREYTQEGIAHYQRGMAIIAVIKGRAGSTGRILQGLQYLVCGGQTGSKLLALGARRHDSG